MGRLSVSLEPFLDAFAKRANVGVGRAARDDEKVGHVRDAFEAEDHDVVRLVIQGDGRRTLRKLR